MKLILHIGTEKTGTTTFQNWLSKNRELLKRQKIWYSKSLGEPDNRSISICARDADKPDDGFWQNNLTDAEKHREFYIKVKQAFDQEVKEAFDKKCKYFIISDEHLHSRIVSDQMVDRVQTFIGNYFESIEVVAHLRPQVDVMVSLASTASRVGHKVNYDFFKKIKNTSPYLNYEDFIARWERAFHPENILILPFKKKPSITDFIIEKLKINLVGFTQIEIVNEAVDIRTMALVNALNTNKELNTNHNIFINELPKNEKLAIGMDLAKSIQTKFDKSNSELVKKRHDINFEDLQPDWKKYDMPSNIDILEYQCPFSEQLDALVQLYNMQLNLERARTFLAESERAFLAKNKQNANHFLEKALQLLDYVKDTNVLDKDKKKIIQRVNNIKKKLNITKLGLLI
ncbi:MAG: hypothetical protein GVY04_08460 [Cyanobacteria bacterium]|nr:hypothetical protein [Cyanobacteria bacterium GSL.Bin1]